MTTYDSGEPEPVVLRLIGLLEPGSDVLDLGCGAGRNAIPLARGGMCVVGWDKSEKEIGILNRQAKEESLRIQTVHCDMRDLRIGYNRWHAILTILCMHCLRYEEAVKRLEHIRTNILPDGYHALSAFIRNDASDTEARRHRFYPTAEEVLAAYAGWDILWQGEDAERLTLLARKPARRPA